MVEIDAQLVINGVLDSFSQMRSFKGAFLEIGDSGWQVNKMSLMEGVFIHETRILNCYVLEVACSRLNRTEYDQRLCQSIYLGLNDKFTDALAVTRSEQWVDGPCTMKISFIMPVTTSDKYDAVRSS